MRQLLSIVFPRAQGNFRDMGEHRTVSTDEPLAFIRHMERSVAASEVLWAASHAPPPPPHPSPPLLPPRPDGAAEVRYCETSMKDCFGLSYLHKFFSVPFLQMQVGRRGFSHCFSCTVHTHLHAHTHHTCRHTPHTTHTPHTPHIPHMHSTHHTHTPHTHTHTHTHMQLHTLFYL